MNNSKKLLVKEDSLLLEVLVKLINERLTKKQKLIIDFLSKSENKFTATSLVRKLSKELNCSKSALWNNLQTLKKCGLLENKAGEAIKLSQISKIVLLGGEKDD